MIKDTADIFTMQNPNHSIKRRFQMIFYTIWNIIQSTRFMILFLERLRNE